MATSWAELQATLTLETRGFEAGAARATAQAGGLQSRLGSVNAVAGRMRGAMSQVTSAMGGVAGQAGATAAAVANMVSAFQAGPIVAAAAGITAALTSYFAVWNKQLDEARARIEEYIRVNKSIRGILKDLDIVPDDTDQLQAWTERMERADDEAAILRRLEIARMDAAEIPPTSDDPAALARLELLKKEIALLEEAAKRVTETNAKRAASDADARMKQIEANRAQLDAVRDVQRQRELVGRSEADQAQIRKRHAAEDLANAQTTLEVEKARLALREAEEAAFQESLPKGFDEMGEPEKPEPPKFERLVEQGALEPINIRLRRQQESEAARLDGMGKGLPAADKQNTLQNVANQQLTEMRRQTDILREMRTAAKSTEDKKQTAILQDIERKVGGF